MIRTKLCSKCGRRKPIDEFPPNKNRCKKCKLAYERDYRKKNPDNNSSYRRAYTKTKGGQRYNRKYTLRFQHGITPEQYEDMFNQQGRVCAICGSKKSRGRWSSFHVDHDHNTDKIRGLLCHFCNIGIGHFSENPETLRRAAEYLEKYQ